MNRNSLVAAAVIVVMASYVGWESLHRGNLQTELDALRAAHARWSKDYEQRSDQFKQTVAELQQQLKQARDQLALIRPATVSAIAAATLPQPQVATAVNATEEKFIQIERRRLALERTVETRYGVLISSLKLAPQVEKILKQRILDVLLHEAELSQKIFSGEVSPSETQRYDAVGEISKIMDDYTTAQQKVAVAEHQAQIAAKEKAQVQYVMSRSLEMNAPGLTDASKTLVSSALADSMTAPRKPVAAGSDPNGTVSMYQGLEAQLQGKLPDDQMKIVKEYVQRQIQSTRASQPNR